MIDITCEGATVTVTIKAGTPISTWRYPFEWNAGSNGYALLLAQILYLPDLAVKLFAPLFLILSITIIITVIIRIVRAVTVSSGEIYLVDDAPKNSATHVEYALFEIAQGITGGLPHATYQHDSAYVLR